MLKSIVNGAEHDIVRIPMKGKNLLNIKDGTQTINNVVWTASHGSITAQGTTTSVSDSDAIVVYDGTFTKNGNYINYCKIQASKSIKPPAGTYTFSANANPSGDERIALIVGDDGTYFSNYTARKIAVGETFSVNGNEYVMLVVSSIISLNQYNFADIMLNTGYTALPYEPYGYQNGWEVRDNQNRIIWGREDDLQTTTGNLLFKGYDLPVKVNSLLGNSVQNGTPSPSPVNPNLVDPSKTVPGYQQSNGTIHEPSGGNERTTDWIPFTTDTLYAIVSGSNGGNINWVLYDSNKQPLYFYGPTFSPNTVIIISRSGYSAAAFIRISWTNAINQPICVTTEQRSEYIPFDPNPSGPIIPEMCGVRTDNLVDKSKATLNAYISSSDGTIGSSTVSNVTDYIDIDASPFVISGIRTTDLMNTGSRGICFFNADKEFTGGVSYSPDVMSNPFIASQPSSNVKYVRFAFDKAFENSIMLNTGSNALQFEPYGWKIPFENHGENLCSISTWTNSQSTDTRSHFQIRVLAYMGNTIVSASPYVNTSNPGVYTTSITLSETADKLVIKHNGSSRDLIVANVMINGTVGESYTVSMYVETNDPTTMDGIKVRDIMLNSGSTPLPYSPYLNKTTPIYLGEVPTIRRIKKLVLTGEENWKLWAMSSSSETERFYINVSGVGYIRGICSHFQFAEDSSDIQHFRYGGTNLSELLFWMNKQTASTVDDFKSYLTQQYQNGTPVTVWYVLSEPETGIVNEPLAKIGNYTDELTEISVHNLSAPLYGIGDYKDILNLSTGVLTRKVKKLVLDGTEGWSEAGSGVSTFYYTNVRTPMQNSSAVCSHFELVMFSSSTYIRIYDRTEAFQDVAAFKSFLQQQYQAGTPVEAWYVLSTPETETVTVPTGMTGEIEGYLTQISTPTPKHPSIPKWNGKEETGGTYAVTVYDLPEIPTTTGKNTLTVETEKIHGLTNPLCGIGDYKDVLNLSTGIITRKIKKLVLTGEESFGKYTQRDDDWLYYYTLGSANNASVTTAVCTHAIYQSYTSQGSSPYARISDTKASLLINLGTVIGNNSIESFKSYITAQYANGTPVTVWYVLNTSETETIAVPYGLECSVEGYLTQSGTPTPSNPITPESNGILESGATYAVEVSLVPSNLIVKGHIKPIQ